MNRFTPDDEEERSLYETLLGQKMTSLHKLYSGQLYESVQKQEIQRCDWSWSQMPTVSLVQQLQEYSCASSPHWRDRPLAKSYPRSIETQERRGSCGILIVVRLRFIFSLYLWLFPHLSIFFLKGLNKTKNSHFLLLQTVFMKRMGKWCSFGKHRRLTGRAENTLKDPVSSEIPRCVLRRPRCAAVWTVCALSTCLSKRAKWGTYIQS